MAGNNDHMAEDCEDPDCPRFICQLWKRAIEIGYKAGYADGWMDGEAAGLASAQVGGA